MKKRLNSLDLVRAAACLGVFSFHCYLSRFGTWGVSVFLLLSGFLMCYNYFDGFDADSVSFKSSLKFSIRRIGKMYPLHILMLLLMTLFYALMYSARYPVSELIFKIKAFFASLFLVQAWIPGTGYAFSYNIVSWYTSVMVFLYFAFPYLLRAIIKYRSSSRAYFTIVVIAALQFASAYAVNRIFEAVPGDNTDLVRWFTYVFPVYRLGDFAIGCNLGYIFLQRERKAPGPVAGTLLELVSIGAVAGAELIYTRNYLPPYISFNLLFTLPSILLIYSFALGAGYISKLAGWKPVKFISDYSGEIYLVQFVMIQYSMAFVNLFLGRLLPLGETAGKVIFIVCAVGGTVIFSLLYRKYLSRLFRHRVRRT
ncbi:MAG: acyltransferase family protein [Candidatus Limivicinus sp.]|jgi:peptidoglycan/LPS O-acetylase OafA/YrhL